MENSKLFDLYSSMVSIDGLLSKPSEDIKGCIEELRKNYFLNEESRDDDSRIECQYYRNVSSAIYSLAGNIKDTVDGLKCITSESRKEYRGITNSSSKKINVMLLGETSAGKTTFLRRMYGETCGKTGSAPITAFPVIHKVTSGNSYLLVKFNSSFSVSESDFKDFLRKYFRIDYFSFISGKCELKDERNKEQQLTEKDSFINCIYEANNFPTAFEEITWYHKESDSKQIQFTHDTVLYDMPGSGGQDEHTSNLNDAINRYGIGVDIVLYLINSADGVPSSYEFLKNLKDKFNRLAVAPEFYFVYQKPDNVDLKNKIYGPNGLADFIKRDTEVNGVPFGNSERKYFLKAHVVDARAHSEMEKNLSRDKADAAMASIYRDYILKKSKDFYKSLSVYNKPQEFTILRKGNEEDQLENHNNEPEIINQRLNGFLEKVRKGERNELYISEIREKFKKEFYISDDIDFPKGCSKDLETTLKDLKKRINGSLDSLLDFCKAEKSTFGKIKPVTFMRKNRDKENQAETIFDITKYNMYFRGQYEKRHDWQSLVYDIQTYHWLRLTYNGDSLNNTYSRASAETVREYLKEYIDRLERLENRLCVMESFGCQCE